MKKTKPAKMVWPQLRWGAVYPIGLIGTESFADYSKARQWYRGTGASIELLEIRLAAKGVKRDAR